MSINHSVWSIDSESVNLPKPFLVNVGLLFAMVHMASTLQVVCSWLPVIAYQGLCATTFDMLLICTVGPTSPDQDICIAADGLELQFKTITIY